MQVTIIRPLKRDIGYLESTWHHVPESEGVRLQLQEELYNVQSFYYDRYEDDIVMRYITQRRIVTGSFHPGRAILPASAIVYEIVYEMISPETMTDNLSDDDFLGRLRKMMSNAGFTSKVLVGDVTQEKPVAATG